jgi:hypothetical protein
VSLGDGQRWLSSVESAGEQQDEQVQVEEPGAALNHGKIEAWLRMGDEEKMMEEKVDS